MKKLGAAILVFIATACTIDFSQWDPRLSGAGGAGGDGGSAAAGPDGGGGNIGGGGDGGDGGGGNGGGCPAQWAVAIGGAGEQLVHDVASNTTLTAITGSFDTEVRFGTFVESSAGGTDIFVAAIDRCGSPLWLETFGSTGDDVGRGVAIHDDGDVVVVGHIAGAVDFGGGAVSFVGGQDVFVLDLTSSGAYADARSYGGTGDDSAAAVDADDLGNFALVGTIDSSMSFGGNTLTPPDASSDGFIAAFSSTHNHLWSGSAPSTGVDSADDVFVDDNSRAYAIGTFTGSINFGGAGNAHTSNGGSADIYVVEFNTMGGTVWSASFGSSQDDQGKTITGVSGDELVIGAIVRGALDFGTGNLPGTSLDYALAKLSGMDGAVSWSLRWGDGNAQCTLGADCDLAIAPTGGTEVIVAGQFADTLDLGSSNVASLGGEDAFLVFVDASNMNIEDSVAIGGAGQQVSWGVSYDGTAAMFGGHFDTAFSVSGTDLTAPDGVDGFIARSSN